MYRTFSILGGDNRFGVVADLLARAGHTVWVWGLNSKFDLGRTRRAEHLSEAVESSDVIILPIPALAADGSLNLPLSEEKLDVTDVIYSMSPHQVLTGGMFPSWLTDMAEKRYLSVVDYGKREDFITANAVPTAEGAIGIAMRELNKTLWDSNCLILGYGRIGKILAHRLAHLCPNLTVTARKQQDLSLISAQGYRAADYGSWAETLKNVDVIFNTVPSLLLTEKVLHTLPKNALVIDLASRPGGTDFKAAEECGIKTIWALSLPGKTAPFSAGKIIANSILAGMQELE